MKMTELKMYEAPKMEVVEVEMETIFAASGTNVPGVSTGDGDIEGGDGSNGDGSNPGW